MNESNLKSSMALRILFVASLAFLLFIASLIVQSLVDERSRLHSFGIPARSDAWSSSQTIAGPFLTIPLRRTLHDGKGTESVLLENLNILPDSLSIIGTFAPEGRHRDLLEPVLYSGHLAISGRLSLAGIRQLSQEDITPEWDDVFLTIGISDVRGIKGNVALSFDDTRLLARAGVRSDDLIGSGITFVLKLNRTLQTHVFQCSVDLNGSSELQFIPLGRRTEVSLSSSWTNPGFTGAFLPNRKATSSNGFSGHWSIDELNRNYPQSWINDRHNVVKSAFGVCFLPTVDKSEQMSRVTKYGILVIAFTFLVLFLSEVYMKEVFHPVHYSLIGLSLVLFDLLVLSLSELLGFYIAYILSALFVLLLVSLYSRAIAGGAWTSWVIAFVLLLSFALLYMIIRIGDYALIIGSLSMALILAILMYFTRKVNWFSVGDGSKVQI
jgi:inner membrane protein